MKSLNLLGVLALTGVAILDLAAQPTAFTYQGRLTAEGQPFSGLAEMQPSLWNAANDGALVAAHSPATITVGVTNGLFTTTFDFDSAPLTGQPLWLQLDVRTGLGAFIPLTPRQQLTATPYAVRALTASNLVGNVTAAQVTGTLATSQVPASVVTNGAAGLTLSGTFAGNGAGLANVNAASLGGLAASNHWRLTGNQVGANQFLGSVNNANLELRANNEPALRLSYRSNTNYGVAPSVIGGYRGNSASFSFLGTTTDYFGATIGGGGYSNAENFVWADLGTVSGGAGNIASGKGAFVGGGTKNLANGDFAAVLGGSGNRATNDYSTAGGRDSRAGGYGSTAMGAGSTANGFGSTAMGTSIATGSSSTATGNSDASGDFSAASGISFASGNRSTATGNSEASGANSTAMGNSLASGDYSTAMGTSQAIGDYSMAAGQRVTAQHDGCFIWGDNRLGFTSTTGTNQFYIRAGGGLQLDDDTGYPTDLYFGSNTRQMINLWGTSHGIGVQSSTTYFRSSSRFSWFAGGVHSESQNNPGTGGSVLMTLTSGGLTVNGTLVSSSDRNKKENFKPVDPRAVLEKVAALPLSEWNYKDDEEHSRHLGPMAQDFKAAFGVGPDDKHITTVDADGVALAAIQGLNQKVDDRMHMLEQENAELKKRLDALERILRARKSN